MSDVMAEAQAIFDSFHQFIECYEDDALRERILMLLVCRWMAQKQCERHWTTAEMLTYLRSTFVEHCGIMLLDIKQNFPGKIR